MVKIFIPLTLFISVINTKFLSTTQNFKDDKKYCVACRFIWENIEESFGESKNAILAAESFQYYCKISPDIFYDPVILIKSAMQCSIYFMKCQKIMLKTWKLMNYVKNMISVINT